MLSADGGYPCDPAREAPYSMTYRVRGRGFEASEGRSVYWFVGERPPSARDATRTTTIRGGQFEDAYGPIEAGQPDLVSFYVDVDGNGACFKLSGTTVSTTPPSSANAWT